MSGGGQAMAMRLELARLAKRHRVTMPTSATLPFAAPTEQPLIVEGIAADCTTIDAVRMKFAARAFRLPAIPSRMPKLLFRHDTEQVAGEIKALFHDTDGNLRLRALVTHEQAARAPALSVAVTVLSYRMIDADGPNFYALITEADVPTEISLTPSPANARALVTHRYPEPALLKYFDLMSDAARNMMRQIEIIQQMCREPPAPPSRPKADRGTLPPTPPKPRPRVEPHRATPFGALVSQIEANHRSSP